MSDHLFNIGLLAKVLAIFVVTGFIFLLVPATASATTPECSSNICSCEVGNRQNCTYDSQNGYSWKCALGDEIAICPNNCGNSKIDAGEDCDGTNLNGQTCQSQDYDEGTLGCRNCKFDTIDCQFNNTLLWPFICGNDKLEVNEECDGTNLNDRTCEDFGYVSGDLFCNKGCRFNFKKCVSTVCGDGVISYNYGEQCEVNPLDLDNQSCETLVGGTGNLSCKQENCTFNTDDCVYCGNQRAEGNEECDGIDRRGQTCESLGYGDGLLGCSGCKYLVDDCTGSQSQCLNGVLEGDEQCEFPNQYKDGATCDSLSNGKCSGVLTCNTDCSINNSRCFDNFDPNKPCDFSSAGENKSCENPIPSGWSAYELVKPELTCGKAEHKNFDEAPFAFEDLCKGLDDDKTKYGDKPNYEVEINIRYSKKNDPGTPIGWYWYCGDQYCDAWANPKCRSDFAVESSDKFCSATADSVGFYETYDDYLAQRNSTDKVGWTKLCDYGQPFADGPLEGSCQYNINKNYRDYNENWGCQIADKKTYCAVSWGEKSFCGSLNGHEYKARRYSAVSGWSKCSDSRFWGVENRDEQPYLCASGSYLVPDSMEYRNKLPDGTKRKNLAWQCQWKKKVGDRDDDGLEEFRYGPIVDCGVELVGACPDDGDAKCGNDARRHFASRSVNLSRESRLSAPGKELCELGTPVKDDPFYRDATWFWDCQSKAGGKTEHCSIEANIVCASATYGFPNEEKLRDAPPCLLGKLSNDRIYSNGSTWYWYCVYDNFDKQRTLVRCDASKCGFAGEGAFRPDRFDSLSKTYSNFLCNNNASASKPVLTYDDVFQRYQWSWDCNYGANGGYVKDCKATQLECGWADKNTYSESDWNIKKAYWPTFLCSSSFLLDNQESNLIDYEEPSADNNWRWKWNCLAKSNETIPGGCYANAYHCGEAEGVNMTPETFNTRWADPSYNDFFCPHGSRKVYVPGNDYWQCWTPESTPEEKLLDKNLATRKLVDCKFSFTTCGEAIEGNYTTETLRNNIDLDNGFLCNGAVKKAKDVNGDIIRCWNINAKPYRSYCEWDCSDDYGNILTSACESEDTVSCSSVDNTTVHKNNFWNSNKFKACVNGNITPDKEDIENNRASGNGLGVYNKWYWRCQDNNGGKSRQCQASCVEGSAEPYTPCI